MVAVDLASALCILASAISFGFYRYRSRFLSWERCVGEVVSVEEGRRDVSELYYSSVYVYPILYYKYQCRGGSFSGAIGRAESLMYESRLVEKWGAPLTNADFFWRNLDPGDPIDLYVDPKNCRNSRVGIGVSRKYVKVSRYLLSLALTLVVVGGASLFA